MKKIYLLLLVLFCFVSSVSKAQCTTASVTPYFESFSTISTNNELPLCWAASNMSVSCLTFAGGNNSAGFYYQPAGNSYFYSNAIQLVPGITYSMSALYKLSSASNDWTNFSLYIGTSQSSTGLVPVASTTGTITNMAYAPLSNTFVVSSAGVYYVAVEATSNGVSGTGDLIWDDLEITTPCSMNTPSVSITSGGASTVCAGSSLTLTAFGADKYVWDTGTITTETLVTGVNSSYTVTGTNSVTGCSDTAVFTMTIHPSPTISVTASSATICPGSTVQLTGGGSAATYSWNGGQQTATIFVSPTVATNYVATGTSTDGCSSSTTILISMYPLPVITYTSSALTPTICSGAVITINAAGADTYVWNWASGAAVGATVQFSSYMTSTISIKGISLKGCSSLTNYVLNVENCTGLGKEKEPGNVILYPNPGTGEYTLHSGNRELKAIRLIDLTGKIVFSMISTDEAVNIDVKELSPGVYHLQLISGNSIRSLKVIKN